MDVNLAPIECKGKLGNGNFVISENVKVRAAGTLNLLMEKFGHPGTAPDSNRIMEFFG